MAKRQPSSDLRGVILPEPNILEATYTATSQAGPRAGAVVPDQTTGLSLHGSGEIDATSESSTGTEIELATARGGGVGDATIRWRFAGDTYRSWDAPVALAGWEYVSRSTTANRYRAPHAVRRSSTGLACIAATYDTNTVEVWAQSSRGKWTSATVENTGAATRATLVDLPTGRLACIYAVKVATSVTQLRMAYSDDDGATWETGTSACLATPLACASSAVIRLRAAELNGQIALFVWTQATLDEVYQYVSSDGGNTFALVETLSTSTIAYPDVAALRGALYLVALKYDASFTPSTIRAQSRKLTSAAQPASTASTSDIGTASVWGSYSGGQFQNGDLAIAATDDGFLWVYGVDFDGSGTRAGIIRGSPDGGANWYDNHSNSHGGISGTLLAWNGDSTTCLRELSACPERGRVLLAHTPQTSPGGVATNFTSLCAGYLGGWSTVGMADPRDGEWWEQAGWDYAYLPIDIPTETGTLWTRTLTGAATEALGANGITLTATGADRVYYTHQPTISTGLAEGILAEWQLEVTAGTLMHDLILTNGTNGYYVRVSATTTQVEVLDMGTGGAGTSLHTLSIDTTKGIVLRLALDNTAATWTGATGRVRAWARIDGPYTGAVSYGPRQDREWTHIGSTATLTSSALTNNVVRWGSVSAAGTGRYRWLLFSTGTQTAGNLADSVNGDIHGAIVPPASSPQHLTDGVRIHGVDGPTTAGDTYSMMPAYEYPVSAINPSVAPSPRRTWRSTRDNLQQDIILSGVDLGARAGDSWGVYVAGANFGTATLYRDSTGTNKVLDLDMTAGLVNLGFTRTRDLVYPSAGGSGSSSIYFGEGALAGCYVDLGSGIVRKIKGNTSGAWTGGGTGAYASTRLTLDSYDAGDPNSGTTAKIRMNRALWIVETMQTTDTLMLRIPVQDTAEDYFQLGTLVIGRVRWFGRHYSRGRSLTFTPAYEVAETRGGARRVRKLGPTRRALEVAWDDGVDTTGLHSIASGAPDYWTLGYTGADGVADIAGTGRTLAGVIASTAGAYLPVVLAAAVPQQASAPGTAGIPILDPERHLYGRIVTESLRVDSDPNVMGDEFRDPGEVVKVGNVRIEEEV